MFYKSYFFLCLQPPGPGPRPHLLLYNSDPNYFFIGPNYGITFSRPPSIKNYLFTAPNNNNSFSRLFFTSLNKTQPTSIRKFLSAKSLIMHKPVNCSANRLTVFHMIQIEKYFWINLKYINVIIFKEMM